MARGARAARRPRGRHAAAWGATAERARRAAAPRCGLRSEGIGQPSSPLSTPSRRRTASAGSAASSGKRRQRLPSQAGAGGAARAAQPSTRHRPPLPPSGTPPPPQRRPAQHRRAPRPPTSASNQPLVGWGRSGCGGAPRRSTSRRHNRRSALPSLDPPCCTGSAVLSSQIRAVAQRALRVTSPLSE